MRKSALKDIVTWRIKRQTSCTKSVSTLGKDDHHNKKEDSESVGELSKVYSQIVLNCWYLARIGRLDILWSLDTLARAVTKWTRACDKRLTRLISCIHHKNDYGHYCWNSAFTSTERSVRDRVANSTSSSHEWHRDDNPFSSTERSVRERSQRSSTGKLVRGIQNQVTEVKLDHHNLQVSDTRYIEKIFANVRQKLNRLESDPMLDTSKPFTMWMMDLEARQDHAESIPSTSRDGSDPWIVISRPR